MDQVPCPRDEYQFKPRLRRSARLVIVARRVHFDGARAEILLNRVLEHSLQATLLEADDVLFDQEDQNRARRSAGLSIRTRSV